MNISHKCVRKWINGMCACICMGTSLLVPHMGTYVQETTCRVYVKEHGCMQLHLRPGGRAEIKSAGDCEVCLQHVRGSMHLAAVTVCGREVVGLRPEQ